MVGKVCKYLILLGWERLSKAHPGWEGGHTGPIGSICP